jgi:hypothetical protein
MVSMGLGPMNPTYQARFNHYLHDWGIKDTSDQHVWAFLVDGDIGRAGKPRAGACRCAGGAGQPCSRLAATAYRGAETTAKPHRKNPAARRAKLPRRSP